MPTGFLVEVPNTREAAASLGWERCGIGPRKGRTVLLSSIGEHWCEHRNTIAQVVVSNPIRDAKSVPEGVPTRPLGTEG